MVLEGGLRKPEREAIKINDTKDDVKKSKSISEISNKPNIELKKQ